jgi:hypothetical protein
MRSQEFSIWNCIYHRSGLADAHCNLNGTPQLDHCKGECDHWINRKGENHEQVLERLVNAHQENTH